MRLVILQILSFQAFQTLRNKKTRLLTGLFRM
jgi:hypothetical protein